MKKTIFTILTGCFVSIAFSQNVGINTTGAAPDAGAGLDINFNNKGLLIPRVNITNLNTIAPVIGSTTEGLLVYNTNGTTGTGFYYWNGAQWTQLSTGGDGWSTTGNNGTNPTANFLGTTDAQDLVIRTNNNERIRIYAGGRVELNETFDASGAANSGVLEIANSLRLDGNEIITNTNGILYLQNDNNGDLRISNNTVHVDAADNSVGINTTAPTEELHVVGGSRITTGATIGDVPNYGDHLLMISNAQPAVKIGFQGGFNNAESGRIIFDEYADNYLNIGTYCGFQFQHDGAANKLFLASACTGETRRVTFERNGEVGIATENPTALLSVNGTANKTGGGTWAVFSDQRLKKDIQNYDEGLELINQIQPVKFRYNETMQEIWGDSEIQNKIFHGVIAQDIQKIAPDMVREVSLSEDYSADKDGGSSNSSETYLEVDPNKFTYALINAVKQQSKIIENQEEKISTQEEKISELEERILRLERLIKD